jgi:hypothetical protein
MAITNFQGFSDGIEWRRQSNAAQGELIIVDGFYS